ncbi:MAG TPA: tRNA uracil 4-sulfurtransferase ThiI [Myxococcota bacterium]|nr:tRNA uracil 4-sulfurtransferase ThiI [Myxococcota bacterium]
MGEAASRFAVLRFSGELSIKARGTRTHFRRRLLMNLRDALASEGLAPRIEVSHERLYVELPGDGAGESLSLREHALARVFGISSVSLAVRHAVVDTDDVVRTGAAIFRERVRGKRFAVRARRVGERHTVRAERMEVERRLGAALLPFAAGVDLVAPETTAHVELSSTGTAFFSERSQGPGGLPLGVEGRAVALLSGGFDSAVAAWQMQRRGVALDLVFCNLGGASHLRGAARVAKVLAERWSYGERPALHAIDFEPVAAAIRAHTDARFWQVLLKRTMLRAAEAVARERRAVAIVTGDAVGQVSSQTLHNLAVVSAATELPILRPLVGANKDEIIECARRIGTAELSKVVGEYCAMVPRRPATRAPKALVEEQEARLPAGLLEALVAKRSLLDLRSLDLEALDTPGLAIDRLPPGCVVLDLRPIESFRSEHHPEALHLEFSKALEAYPHFERGRRYVLCCEFGLLSAHLAERMRRDGFDAWHFSGGQRALMQAARSAARSEA